MADIIRTLKLNICCKNNAAGCVFESDIESIIDHEEDCDYSTVTCPVLNCIQKILFNKLEDHMAEKHENMMDGKWIIKPSVSTVAITF